MINSSTKNGFTLIEMSIVLVIIGLIVGGVLVGQDLIRAAAVRATIAQIEKYNTATNTFYGKYGYLPGDIIPAAASQFGFVVGPGGPGGGDGNGILQAGSSGSLLGNNENFCGEPEMYWVDLSQIGLVEGGFSSGSYTCPPTPEFLSGTAVGQYLPQAKIGRSNYIFAWSGGWQGLAPGGNPTSNSHNYFTVGVLGSATYAYWNGLPFTDMGLTVQEAYNIDKKMDDGLPQSGNVTAMFMSWNVTLWSSSLANDSAGTNTFGAGLSDSGGGPVTSPSSLMGGIPGPAPPAMTMFRPVLFQWYIP